LQHANVVYHVFALFSHLGGLLSDEPVGTELRMNESVITGSDEEKAVAKAL